MKNMLEYINSGNANDEATKAIDNEVREARLKEEWRSEYMLTLVHDKDVYRDGFDDGYEDGLTKGLESRQAEFDALTKALADKDSSLSEKDAEINRILKEFEEYKLTHK